MSVGFSEDEMRDAWDQARAAGFAESTGLGQDRLTGEAGLAPSDLRESCGRRAGGPNPKSDSPIGPPVCRPNF